MPGVLLVLTGEDVTAEGLGDIPCQAPLNSPDQVALHTYTKTFAMSFRRQPWICGLLWPLGRCGSARAWRRTVQHRLRAPGGPTRRQGRGRVPVFAQ